MLVPLAPPTLLHMDHTEANPMTVESSEDIGPLLMHDPDDDDSHSLSHHDADSLLSDVHLPEESNFITAEVDKDHQLSTINQGIVDEHKNSNVNIKPGEDEAAQSMSIKFTDGQPVQLEDGSTAYILTSYKEGTQPIILEDGTSAYISHDPPSSLFDPSLESSSLGLDNISTVSEAEEKRLSVPTAVNDQRIFKCEFEGCKKVYTTSHHLQYHRRSHLEKKPFVCGFSGCEKTFATSYGLKSHIRVHTGEKPYKCPEPNCKKAFKTSGDLQKHIRTHTGEKPFRCPFEGCNRSFTTSNIRKVHIRTHTGERPYSCDQCGRTFASATNHKNHLRIHTGEKPYACTYEGCNKRFTEYSSLYKHHVVHTQAKPYVCSTCGKHYRQTSTLAMHRRTAHGETDVIVPTAANDVIAGQLIALDQNKEIVGIIRSAATGSKQLNTTAVLNASQLIPTSPNSLAPKVDGSSISLSDIDTHNVVIVTDQNCFRVIQSQVASTSQVGASIQDSSCMLSTNNTNILATQPAHDEPIVNTSNLVIVSESLDRTAAQATQNPSPLQGT